MIIPFLGFVGRRNYSVVSGLSNGRGFMLRMKNRTGREFIFQSSQYNAGEIDQVANEQMVKMGKRIILALLFTIPLALLLPIFYKLHFLSIFLLPVAVILGAFMIIAVSHWPGECYEWHACEHKSIVLLNAGLEPTAGNLRRCPQTLIGCGTYYHVLLLQIVLSLFLSLEIGPYYSFLVTPCYWIAISSAVLLFHSFFFSSMLPRFLCVSLFFFPGAITPLLFERMFAIRTPSREKLSETAEELRQFHYTYGL